MVTLELPQARRLAASVVLGQVVVTVVAAIICFAVWGRVAGWSALAGGGISVLASAALALFGFSSPEGAPADTVVYAGYPVEWTFTPEGLSCAGMVELDQFGVGLVDAVWETQTVTFTPPAPGVYEYECWMGMYTGTFTVIEPPAPWTRTYAVKVNAKGELGGGIWQPGRSTFTSPSSGFIWSSPRAPKGGPS